MTHTFTTALTTAQATARNGLVALGLACVLSSALLSGCFSTPQPECAFACSEEEQCPDDYRCTPDKWCKRNDIAADFFCGSSLIDATPADARSDAMPMVDASVDATLAADASTDASTDAMVDAMPTMVDAN